MAMRFYSMLQGKSSNLVELMAIKNRLVLGVVTPAAVARSVGTSRNMRRLASTLATAKSTTKHISESRRIIPSTFTATAIAQRCSFSTSSSPPPTACDIVKGPSLLRTTHHRPRPSLLQLPGLRSLPFWSQVVQDKTRVAYQDPALQWAVQHLEQNWQVFLHEYQESSSKLFSDYEVDTEHNDKLLHKGTWDWHSYMLKGQADQPLFKQHFPESARLIQELRDANLLFEQVPFGYTFFSTLHPNSQIDAHAAPMNFRIRVHLPLIVPSADSSSEKTTNGVACGIRVGPTTREWETGKALLLDDSYDHQVWNHTDSKRVLFLVDLWHPDITPQERKDIVELFDHAKKEGWWTTPSTSSQQ